MPFVIKTVIRSVKRAISLDLLTHSFNCHAIRNRRRQNLGFQFQIYT